MAIMVMTHSGICTIALAKLEHTKLLSESKAKKKKKKKKLLQRLTLQELTKILIPPHRPIPHRSTTQSSPPEEQRHSQRDTRNLNSRHLPKNRRRALSSDPIRRVQRQQHADCVADDEDYY